MDGVLMNEKLILNKILDWLKSKKVYMDDNFCCDFHIDCWSNVENKAEWLKTGLEMYTLLQNNIGKSYPHLKVMIAFYLCSTSHSKKPKSLSKRNFRGRVYTPPVIFLYSDKRSEKDIMGEDAYFLSEISEKYKLKAYYSEVKEDVVYRTVFMFSEFNY